MDNDLKNHFFSIQGEAIKVITNPKKFYQEMPKTGGFLPPLIFMVALSFLAGIVGALLGLIGLSSGPAMGSGIAAIIIIPVMTAIFGFVGAAILFIIWNLMGSKESYETAYRCGAYSMAIIPITIALNIIPYLGSVLGMVWGIYLIIVASTEVHGIAPKTAATVFGIICAVFVLFSIGGECARRKLGNRMEKIQKEMNLDSKDPAEIMKGMGKMFEEMGKKMEETQKGR